MTLKRLWPPRRQNERAPPKTRSDERRKSTGITAARKGLPSEIESATENTTETRTRELTDIEKEVATKDDGIDRTGMDPTRRKATGTSGLDILARTTTSRAIGIGIGIGRRTQRRASRSPKDLIELILRKNCRCPTRKPSPRYCSFETLG